MPSPANFISFFLLSQIWAPFRESPLRFLYLCRAATYLRRSTFGPTLRRFKHQHCSREWLFSTKMMEISVGNVHSHEKHPFQGTTHANETRKPKPVEKNTKTTVFVNHAANAWHESRKKWIGDTQRSKKMEKDPIISWSTTYEDLLSTNDPFAEPIPLAEMVDFLVDIWLDEGLYD